MSHDHYDSERVGARAAVAVVSWNTRVLLAECLSSLHEDASAVRRRVVEALKLTYYRLAYVQQTVGILDSNDQLLGQLEQVVESRYGVGQGGQQDVLRAQLQHTKLLQEVAMRHQEEGQLQARLKQTLNRPQTSPDVVAEPLDAEAVA